jgi:hypothetical protein
MPADTHTTGPRPRHLALPVRLRAKANQISTCGNDTGVEHPSGHGDAPPNVRNLAFTEVAGPEAHETPICLQGAGVLGSG